MYRNYGSVILKKDSIIYHTSIKDFTSVNNSQIPLLFCSFHPSEYSGDENKVHYIKLKKNVRLLFMVDNIKSLTVISSLENFINNNKKSLRLPKLNNNVRRSMAKLLKEGHFNGWFSSIEDGATLEIALLNDLTLFECVKSDEYKNNINYNFYINENTNLSNRSNKNIINKLWGTEYKICGIEYPINFYLNIKYKIIIEKFMKYCINTQSNKSNLFYILLENGFIKYHDSNNISNINCVNNN